MKERGTRLLRGKVVRLLGGLSLNQSIYIVTKILSLISLTYTHEVIMLAVKKKQKKIIALMFFARFSLSSYLHVALFQICLII